jgi:hypothetical protein
MTFEDCQLLAERDVVQNERLLATREEPNQANQTQKELWHISRLFPLTY